MKIEIELEEVKVEKSIECGFRQEWLSGGNGNINLVLASGAGFGNSWLTLVAEFPDGTKRYFRYDMKELIQEVGSCVLAELEIVEKAITESKEETP